MKLRHIALSLVLALPVAALLPAAAFAQLPAAAPAVVVYGSVSALAPSCTPPASNKPGSKPPACTFTVTTPTAGDVQITTLPRTTYTPNSSGAAVVGFALHDSVFINGRQAVAAVVAVRILFDSVPFALPHAKVRYRMGKFLSVTASTLTIGSGGPHVYGIGPATVYHENGKLVKTPVYSVGDQVRVYSQLFTDGQQWAETVFVKHKKHKS